MQVKLTFPSSWRHQQGVISVEKKIKTHHGQVGPTDLLVENNSFYPLLMMMMMMMRNFSISRTFQALNNVK
ncbi:CLUMA_CG012881, isoform A [Clunio marinus]|uniref:CLUMA_CG012881, isoform A n=1 Tax=Clunio marinus TaxID=568069 RepID=A0A1J1IH41_9DIPT|nr:CLUMA_CG012881, isoform A [Clunio marinus]